MPEHVVIALSYTWAPKGPFFGQPGNEDGTKDHPDPEKHYLGIGRRVLGFMLSCWPYNEVPIFDGSSANIVDAIHHVGIIALDSHRTHLEVVAPVRVELDAGTWAQLIPAPSLQLDISINFTDPGIGEQSYRYDSRDEHFSTEIAHARTFCVYSDVEKMRRAGLGKGGSLENALVYDNGILMNEGGLRMENECVKHKALDCIGDLYLAGMPIKGLLIAERPGHRLSTLLVQALLRDESAYRIVSSDEDVIASSADTIQMTLAASA